jgi:hypothetical protein
MTVGEMLEPEVGAMRKELLAGSYIQADETPMDVQMRDKRGKKWNVVPSLLAIHCGSIHRHTSSGPITTSTAETRSVFSSALYDGEMDLELSKQT